MRKQTILLMVMAVIFATASISRGDFTGYITTGTEVVWTNFETGEQTSLGPSGIDNIMAMDISPVDGSLYATDDYGQLWKVDTISGAGSLIGNVARCTDALSFAPDGTLYGTLEFNRLRKINIDTADAITIGPLFSYTSAYTLAIDSSGEAVAWDRRTGSLFEIDLSNGSTTLIGNVGTTVAGEFGSLEYGPNGTLYGWHRYRLYSIDVDSLEVTFLRSFSQGYVGGAGGGGSLVIISATVNSSPVADAGEEQSVFVTDTVSLDGSGSSDADGDSLTFYWSFIEMPLGSTTTLSDPTAVTPTFMVDKAGTYEVQLIVNDGTYDSEPDTVIIDTLNSAPIANAGPDQTAYVGNTVTLDGSSSSDVDNDSLTYSWSLISVPAGSSAAFSNPTSVNPTFVIDVFGDYEAQLIVNDGTVDSAPDAVVISTLNSAPVADAGPDQMLLAPIGGLAEVILDGSGSTDVDGDGLSYQWTWTTGSADGMSPTIALPIGVHTIRLIVNDRTVDSEPDDVVIEVVDVTIALAEKISTVLADKLVMLEQINTAIETEQQVYDALEELLASGVFTGLAHGDMVKAKQKIFSAMQHQEQAKKDLENSIEKLEDALDSLGSPVAP